MLCPVDVWLNAIKSVKTCVSSSQPASPHEKNSVCVRASSLVRLIVKFIEGGASHGSNVNDGSKGESPASCFTYDMHLISA